MLDNTVSFASPVPDERIQELIKLCGFGQFKLALSKAEHLILSFPTEVILLNIKGVALMNLGRLETAKDTYEKALIIKPDYVEGHNNLGNTYNAMGDLEAALVSFAKASQLDPNFAAPHYNMANIFQERRESNRAIESFKSAISIQPNYPGAYCNLGIVFQRQEKLKDAIDCYKIAIKQKPDYDDAYSNMAGAFQQAGKLEEAIEANKQALRINPNSALALKNLNSVSGQAVPAWHLPMLNDNPRNKAYLEALKLAATKDDMVLDVGTGSGLLSMMAADIGVKGIITCEVSKTIASNATNIIRQNGFSNQITVINKKSTELIVGEDLPRKADLLVSEVLSSEFVGEEVQSTMLDSRKRLLKANGKVIPESGAIMIALVANTPEVEQMVFVNKVEKYDLSEFNAISQHKFSFPLKEKPILLSDPKAAFNFNLNEANKIQTGSKILELTANGDNVCAGIIQWIKVHLYANVEYENNPTQMYKEANKVSGWMTPIYRFDKPTQVKPGQILEINATLFEDSVWFSKFKTK